MSKTKMSETIMSKTKMNYYANMRRIFNDEFDKVIMKFIHENSNIPWNWTAFSQNPIVSIEMIENYPGLSSTGTGTG